MTSDARSFQILSRNIQEGLIKIYRCLVQVCLGISRDVEECLKMSRSVQVCISWQNNDFGNFFEIPRMSRISVYVVNKCLGCQVYLYKLSTNVQNVKAICLSCQQMSGMIRLAGQVFNKSLECQGYVFRSSTSVLKFLSISMIVNIFFDVSHYEECQCKESLDVDIVNDVQKSRNNQDGNKCLDFLIMSRMPRIVQNVVICLE